MITMAWGQSSLWAEIMKITEIIIFLVAIRSPIRDPKWTFMICVKSIFCSSALCLVFVVLSNLHFQFSRKDVFGVLDAWNEPDMIDRVFMVIRCFSKWITNYCTYQLPTSPFLRMAEPDCELPGRRGQGQPGCWWRWRPLLLLVIVVLGLEGVGVKDGS